MKKIALITAMESEFNEVRSLYDFRPDEAGLTAKTGDTHLLLIQCGMGKVNAAVAAERACLWGAEAVLSLGIAGGLDTSLHQSDTVISDRVAYHDVWCGEPNRPGQIQDLPLYYDTPLGKSFSTNDSSVKKGLIVTGDQFVTDKAALAQIKANFPDSLAVDMESAAIAQVCYLNHKNFVSVRMISDVVGTNYQEEDYRHFFETCSHQLAEQAGRFIGRLCTVK